MKRRDILNKGMIRRAAMMLLLMLLTTASAWAFKTETPTLYTISGSSNGFRIFGNGSQTDSWIATNATWAANDSHKLANGITIKPNANLRYQNGNLLTLNSITFTFTAPSTGNIAIASVVFKDISNHDISATHSDPGTTYTVTLASGSVFNGFTLTYGTISGSCGDKAKWTLSKQNGQYTALAISGSGAMKDYYYTTVDNDKTWRTDAPWGWQDLKSVTIGYDITSIGEYAFIGCQQLATVSIGNIVQSIGAFAFNHCDALTEVTLPDFVASIGKECFRNSANLQRVNILRDDGLTTLGSKCFNGCDKLQYIVVPTPALALQYKDATNWSASKEKIRVKIGNQLFNAIGTVYDAAYQIANETDLRNLASAINDDASTGGLCRQTDDITLSSNNFSPIGNNSHYFSGIYDGGGHTISGLRVSQSDGATYYGLFGYVRGGTVKNVRLISPSVSVGNVGSSTHYGALIGRSYLSTVENSVVLCPNVEGSGGTKGAIIGSSNGVTLRNLYFYEGNCSNAIGYREHGTITNVGRACKVTLGSGVSSISPTISPDATNLVNGFVYKNNSYYREGLVLTLTTNLSTTTGYQINYKADNKVIGTPYTVNSTDGDVTLTAEQMNNTYTVHFDGNGSTSGSMSDQDFTYDVPQNLSANAFRRTFTVTYKNNGGTGGTNSATATATFNGWAKSAGGTVAYANHESVINLNTTNDATVELYANWTDGSVTLPTPSKLGNNFGGWYSDEGLTAKVGDAGDSYQPSVDITLYAKWTHSVPYIDANGNEQTCNGCTVLTNETDVSNLSAGWYVVKGNVSYNSSVRCYGGDMHLILCDGAKMTVTIQSNVNASAIHIHDGSLNIYTQSTGNSMGQLEATGNNNAGLYARNNNITICGGRITATGKNSSGISAQNNITIHSGQVSAMGGPYGIAAQNVTIGLRNTTDYITANKYYGSIRIADGQTLTDGTNIYSGELDWNGVNAIAGKTLRRVFNLVTLADNANNSSTISNNNNKTATVVLSGRTLYRDGAWNTLCLPFAVSDFTDTPLEGATVKELLTTSNLDNGTLTLNFSSSNVTAIEAGKPYIVKWTTTSSDITNPVFHGVTIDGTNRDVDFAGGTFKGNYSPLEITDANREDIVLLAAGNKLGYAKTDRTLGACHAYFEIPGSAQARRFVLNVGDGETTGLRPLSGSPEGEGFDGVWHDLQGRRIGNGQKPSAKGMYIVNGKVAVVK